MRIIEILSLVLLLSLLSCGAYHDDQPQPGYPHTAIPSQTVVRLAMKAEYGNYLVTDSGKTLYISGSDVDGNSHCAEGCTHEPFYAADLSVDEKLNKEEFATIRRPDGSPQTTYRGWPLYSYPLDDVPGEVSGESPDELWYVAKPDYSLLLADRQVAGQRQTFLVDGFGRSLYYHAGDDYQRSSCFNGCIDAWPVFFVENIVLPSFLAGVDIHTMNRPDRLDQIAFVGSPLYYFSYDARRGEVKGEKIDDGWALMTGKELLSVSWP